MRAVLLPPRAPTCVMPPSQTQSTGRKGHWLQVPDSDRQRRAGARTGSSDGSRATASGYNSATFRL